MPLIDLLRHHAHGLFRRLKLGPINNRSVRARRFSEAAARWLAEAGPGNRIAAGRRDAIHGDAVINIGVVDHRIVVDDGGLPVDDGCLGARQAVIGYVVRAKVSERDERKGIDAQAEVEARAHGGAIISPA